MIARGFKPVVWVAAVGSAALGCYMLSLRVASERADLTHLQQRIVATQQQIRALQTEVGTRGRLAQLEQWNDEVLALTPPASGQFVQGAQLARFETHEGSPLEGRAEVQMASAEVPATPQPAPAAPTAVPVPQHAVASAPVVAAQAPLRQASVQRASFSTLPQPAPTPARAQPAPQRAAVAARPTPAPIRTASTTARTPASAPAPSRATPAPTPARTRTAVATPKAQATARPAAPARVRTASADVPPRAAAPTRRAGLLDDRTMRDIGATARAERSRNRN